MSRCQQSLLDALMPPRTSTKGTEVISSLCLLCLFMAGFAGCHSLGTGEITIAPEVEPQPPRVGQVMITVRITQAAKPITGARVKFEGNMSHAGMVPVFAEAREIEPGRYRANMELTMAGDWVISVDITSPNGRTFYQQFDIKGVAPA